MFKLDNVTPYALLTEINDPNGISATNFKLSNLLSSPSMTNPILVNIAPSPTIDNVSSIYITSTRLSSNSPLKINSSNGTSFCKLPASSKNLSKLSGVTTFP